MYNYANITLSCDLLSDYGSKISRISTGEDPADLLSGRGSLVLSALQLLVPGLEPLHRLLVQLNLKGLSNLLEPQR